MNGSMLYSYDTERKVNLPGFEWDLTCSSHVQNGNFSKVGASLEGGQHRLPLIVHHLEPASGADVHLLADLPWCHKHTSYVGLWLWDEGNMTIWHFAVLLFSFTWKAKRLDQIETLVISLSRLVWMQGNFANMVDTFSTNIVPRREEDRLES